jgi:hypothetical protein
MKGTTIRSSIAVAVILLGLATAREAFALGGTLESPSIAVSADSGREAKDWLGVLANKKYKYIVGDFINSITNLYYSGDTASLNDFLADLSAVEGTTIHVSFSKESKTASSAFGGNEAHTGPCQWHIQHLGYAPETFHITVFLGDGNVDVSQLNLPAIRTPLTKPAVAKPGEAKPAERTVEKPKPEAPKP